MGELLRASAVLPWQRLAAMTVGLVIALYLWDVVCLLTVFSVDGGQLSYGRMLRARGKSYLVGAWNQGLGQAAVAWDVARLQGTPFAAALSRSILLAWHEGLILATAAVAGSWWSDNPRAAHARAWCAVLLAVLLGAALLLGLVPAGWRRRLQRTRWGAWLGEWSWRRSFRLILLRIVYFAIVGTYVATALWMCGQGIAPATALAVIPLVLLATVLPSASGLGTRETALYLLLPSQRPDVLVAMGLIWSTGVVVVRLGIGLAWLWFGRSTVPQGSHHENRIDVVDVESLENCPLVVAGKPLPLVVALDRVKAEDAHRVGGKAANLGCDAGGRASRAAGLLRNDRGLSTIRVFVPGYGTAVGGVGGDRAPAGRRGEGPRLQRCASGWPPRRCRRPSNRPSIAAWQSRGTTRAYAVRSSATAEDQPRASFAGQGETFLNVCGREALLQSVRACWISLFADRAILYRMHKRIDHRTAAMAVVVQELISPDVSGVLFTADPVSGSRQRMVIEAAYGLGLALVSGEVSPDHLVLSRPELQVLERRMGRKTIEIVPDGSNRVRQRVRGARGGQERLAWTRPPPDAWRSLALEAERALGGPQDLEWAIAGERMFLLQSRPITTLERKAEPTAKRLEQHEFLGGAARRPYADDLVRRELSTPLPVRPAPGTLGHRSWSGSRFSV